MITGHTGWETLSLKYSGVNSSGLSDEFDISLRHIDTVEGLEREVRNRFFQQETDAEKILTAWRVVKNRFIHHSYLWHTFFTNYVIRGFKLFTHDNGTRLDWFSRSKVYEILVRYVLASPPPNNYLAYTIRHPDLIMKSPYAACDQINLIMVELLRRLGYQVAFLATPSHTSALVNLDGEWHIIDADHEITSVTVENYPGLESFLTTGGIRKLYPDSINPKGLLEEYARTQWERQSIFPYDGSKQLESVQMAYEFERSCQKLKYCIPLILFLMALILVITKRLVFSRSNNKLK